MIKKFPLLAVSAGVLLAVGTQAHAGVGGTLTPLIGVATLYDSIVNPNIVAGDPNGTPPDSAALHVDSNVSSSAFSGVVSINIRYHDSAGANLSYICSGTMVNSFQLVSAGHCIDTTGNGTPIVLGTPYTNTTYNPDGSIKVLGTGADVRAVFNSSGSQNAVVTATSVAMDPGYLGFGNCPTQAPPGAFCVNHDMSVITLGVAAPTTAKTYAVASTPLSGPMPITMVGYGTSGTGDVGYTVSPSFAVKRQGQNIAEYYETDDFQGFTGGANGVYYADFDGPGPDQNLFCNSSHAGDWGNLCAPSLANNLESSIGGGDSGGAAFVLQNGKYVLVANNTFSGTYTGQTGGTFGTYFGGINTGSEIAFLQSATAQYGLTVVSVPEPGTYALMLAGLVGVAGIARRRAAAQA